MDAVLDWAGRQFRRGSLTLETLDGVTRSLGQGSPHARIRLRDRSVLRRIVLDPGMQLGETYMEGLWEPAGCRLIDVLRASVTMVESTAESGLARLAAIARSHIGEFNSALIARQNISRHYDLDSTLYESFLDRDLHYSCAYFTNASMDLEAAQQAKCALIAAKLDLRPGANVLDIGCGWGSLALYLAAKHRVRVTGITLSREQLAVAQRRAGERGLEHLVRFRLEDYRAIREHFDAIVSVGMFEHVGRPQYGRFFETVRSLLAPDGTALLHTIGRSGPPGTTSPWIRKYIFPGGYIPAASEILRALEPSGLRLTDLEVWRLHYAHTLAEWHRRFREHRAMFAHKLGERFCRMWEFYLQGSEASFRWGSLVVFQFQLALDVQRLPLTRDYLRRAEPGALR